MIYHAGIFLKLKSVVRTRIVHEVCNFILKSINLNQHYLYNISAFLPINLRMSSPLSIQTSFDKAEMDACNMKCLQNSTHNFLTPSEIRCFNQCTKYVSRSRFSSISSVDSMEGAPSFGGKFSQI